MCLRVDPLKDAAGSSFGKADRLCLYLHDQKLCRVEEHQHQLAHQCSPNIIGISSSQMHTAMYSDYVCAKYDNN